MPAISGANLSSGRAAPDIGRVGRRLDTGRVLRLVLLLLPGLALLAFALIWPLLLMLGVSFQDQYPDPTGFTLQKYTDFLGDPYFQQVTIRTFTLAVTVTIITAILSYPLSWYIARSRSRFKHLVILGVVSPLLVSVVVRTFGWTILLGNEGLLNSILLALHVIREPLVLMQSFGSVVVGMVHVLMPFMVLSIAAVIGRIDPAYGEAAAVLGAGPVRNFWTVALPLSVQGIASGSVIVFCLTIGTYITPLWLGRGHVMVMAISVYQEMVELVDWPTGAAAATVLSVGTLIVLVAYAALIRRYARR